MKFSDIIGQQSIKEKLINAVKNEKISHAMLFISTEGTGGLPLAWAFAQYINCTDRQENDSCGVCPSCKKTAKLIHPDFHFSYPVIKKSDTVPPVSSDFINEWRTAFLENPYLSYLDWLGKMNAENKQGNITISECHAIIKKLSMKAFEASYKILIMWLPEYLGKNGNSLLKIIEEPADKTIFLFVTQNKDLVLNTILSRTQQILLPPLQTAEISDALKKSFQISEVESSRIAELSGGNYSEALRLCGSGVNNHTESFMSWMRLCYQADWIQLHKWLNEFSQSGREQIKDFLLYGLRMIRETILLNNQLAALTHTNMEEKIFAEKFSKFMQPGRALPLYEALNRSYYFIERNANPKILFFDLSLQINKILKNKTF